MKQQEKESLLPVIDASATMIGEGHKKFKEMGFTHDVAIDLASHTLTVIVKTILESQMKQSSDMATMMALLSKGGQGQ